MEVGSNYDLDISQLYYTEDNIYRYLANFNTIYTDSGRSALKLLNRLIPCGKILLPSYICESVIHSYDGFEIDFYQITGDLDIDVNDLMNKLDETVKVLYIMNYFGKVKKELSDILVERRKELGFVIIEDTTHSILTRACTIGDYCICSIRKWFPIADGGILYTKEDISMLKENICNRGGYFQV